MKKMVGVLFILTMLLTGCSGDDTKSYTVSFERNNETDLGIMIVEDGGDIETPDIPSYEGHAFLGWYSDFDLTNIYVFGTEITEDFTLYAKWETGIDTNLSNLPYSEYLSDTNPVVTIEVQDYGIMTLELFPSVAPNTVNNFIMYIENGDFDGNLFHRIIEGFMIQGGNTYSSICPIEGEFLANGINNDLSHFRGAISMARTNIMNSATSQFFIVHEDSFFLDGNYATFGGLVDGFSTLDSIATVNVNSSDAPEITVTITSITIDLNEYDVSNPVCGD